MDNSKLLHDLQGCYEIVREWEAVSYRIYEEQQRYSDTEHRKNKAQESISTVTWIGIIAAIFFGLFGMIYVAIPDGIFGAIMLFGLSAASIVIMLSQIKKRHEIIGECTELLPKIEQAINEANQIAYNYAASLNGNYYLTVVPEDYLSTAAIEFMIAKIRSTHATNLHEAIVLLEQQIQRNEEIARQIQRDQAMLDSLDDIKTAVNLNTLATLNAPRYNVTINR